MTLQEPDVVVVNCAGMKLHEFLPRTGKAFHALRDEDRLYDLEWDDSESFKIVFEDLIAALEWARVQVAAGKPVLVSCAQGKSRSGTLAIAYLMVTRGWDVSTALTYVQKKRPFVQPNPGFMQQLHELQPKLHAAGGVEQEGGRSEG